ncbi:hypothetical protein GUITHDRAFT_152741 [Guillardia theta CCMP2712]|uniref:Uncharacterized protein n=1 Tax=Guillardia theta (strain CCMP2712) TaxID=905079 RepID=L1JAK4_GUITC|nr:hypothetical protein GUITHDRAFT_152741 [Guillardia theta CCMP2712]EKX45134.1 hypothetical protein GUITHDRAFT_152741 [Guillardia theta CCMP2712]|eukprot:XP_005832114.1 hypothetical protein GUITHDRAFT_152741 [Guillardia theta CCMP2712]
MPRPNATLLAAAAAAAITAGAWVSANAVKKGKLLNLLDLVCCFSAAGLPLGSLSFLVAKPFLLFCNLQG